MNPCRATKDKHEPLLVCLLGYVIALKRLAVNIAAKFRKCWEFRPQTARKPNKDSSNVDRSYRCIIVTVFDNDMATAVNSKRKTEPKRMTAGAQVRPDVEL
jgi:hypothetical protein